ncbi:hypothetical protein B9Z19DRAFT_1002092, partial [Tuber borchii]
YQTESFKDYSLKYSECYDDSHTAAGFFSLGLATNGRLYMPSMSPLGIHYEWYCHT